MSHNFQYYSCITAGVAHRCSRWDVFTFRKAPEFTKNRKCIKTHQTFPPPRSKKILFNNRVKMGEYQKLMLVFTYTLKTEREIHHKLRFKAKILQNTNKRTPKISAKWPIKLHNQLPEIRLSSKAIVLKQPIKTNSN